MGHLTLDSELNHFANFNGLTESSLMENNDVNDNEVTILEKIDDIAEGAINSCTFYQKDLLATGSG